MIVGIASGAFDKFNEIFEDVTTNHLDIFTVLNSTCENVREMVEPLSKTFYGPMLYQDMDYVQELVKYSVNEAKRSLENMKNELETGLMETFDEIVNRLDCEAVDLPQITETCQSDIESILNSFRNEAINTRRELLDKQFEIMLRLEECERSGPTILNVRCQAFTIRQIVALAEAIPSNLSSTWELANDVNNALLEKLDQCVPEC